MFIDHSVYPDLDDLPTELPSDFDKADYVHRICSAWDFGIHPDPQTFDLFSGWRDVFDRYPVATSPAYHAMRGWFGWDPLPYPPGISTATPYWVHLDRLEDREDPCEEFV